MAEHTDGENTFRERDRKIRAAIARGEVESVWAHAIHHPGGTMLSMLFAIWPAGVVGAVVGGCLGLGVYLLVHVNASFLVLVGFVIAWLRSLWEYVSSAWFADLRIREAEAESKRVPATADELYMMIERVLTVFRETESVKSPTGFRGCLAALEEYVDVRCEEDKRRLEHSQREYLHAVRERCLQQADQVSGILDRLIVAFDPPNLQIAQQVFGELDTVFRPPEGGDGWDAFVRTAKSSKR